MTCFLCSRAVAEAQDELKSCHQTARASAAYRGIVPRVLLEDVTEAELDLEAAREAARLCDFGICKRSPL